MRCLKIWLKTKSDFKTRIVDLEYQISEQNELHNEIDDEFHKMEQKIEKAENTLKNFEKTKT